MFLQSETHRFGQEPPASAAALNREMPGRNYVAETRPGLSLANKLFEHAHFHHTQINPAWATRVSMCRTQRLGVLM